MWRDLKCNLIDLEKGLHVRAEKELIEIQNYKPNISRKFIIHKALKLLYNIKHWWNNKLNQKRLESRGRLFEHEETYITETFILKSL